MCVFSHPNRNQGPVFVQAARQRLPSEALPTTQSQVGFGGPQDSDGFGGRSQRRPVAVLWDPKDAGHPHFHADPERGAEPAPDGRPDADGKDGSQVRHRHWFGKDPQSRPIFIPVRPLARGVSRRHYLETDPDPIAMVVRVELFTHKPSETNTNWHCMVTHAWLCLRWLLSSGLVDE